MARNKSEHQRRRAIQAYYNALHDFWPEKRGGSDGDSYDGVAQHRHLLTRTYDDLQREDQLALASCKNSISQRFAWMDTELGQTV